MVVGEVAERADVVVIGGGPGGYVAALRCADRNQQVVLIERGAVGGVCLNVGCIPSKVLIHAADVVGLAATSESWGVQLSATVDPVRIQENIADVVGRLTGGVDQLLAAAGVEVWSGEARFARADRLAVVSDGVARHLEFGHCILATGSRPTPLAGLPFDGHRVVDSTGALSFDTVPETLVVVGGGYIGIELGTAWAKLGSAVTIVEAADRILPLIDERLAREVAKRLRSLGVTVLTNTRISGPDAPELAGADKIVVAIGRTPNTDDLGLDHAGVTVDGRGLIDVAPNRSAGRRIYAIGDVTPGPALAHKATAEAEVAAAAIAGEPAAFDPAAIPEVVFSDPEIASVGLDVAAATERGIEPLTFRFPYAAGSRSRTIGDTAGFVNIVADEAGTIIGAQIAGAGAGELINEMSLAIELAATLEEVAGTIHAHPTMAEAIVEAALGALGTPLHVRR